VGLWRGYHDANPRMGVSPWPEWRSAQPAAGGAPCCQAHSDSDRPQLPRQGQTGDMAAENRGMVANPVAGGRITAELLNENKANAKPMKRSHSPLRGETIGSDRSPLRPCREWSRSARVMASDPAAQRPRQLEDPPVPFAHDNAPPSRRSHHYIDILPLPPAFPLLGFAHPRIPILLGCHFWVPSQAENRTETALMAFGRYSESTIRTAANRAM
jgi:hypothetical protein